MSRPMSLESGQLRILKCPFNAPMGDAALGLIDIPGQTALKKERHSKAKEVFRSLHDAYLPSCNMSSTDFSDHFHTMAVARVHDKKLPICKTAIQRMLLLLLLFFLASQRIVTALLGHSPTSA